MTIRVPVLSAAALVILGSPALCQRLYVGGGIGETFFSTEFEDQGGQTRVIDENTTAWKVFGGFSPIGFVGVEGGYRNFGTASTTILSVDVESGTTAWDVAALGRLRIAIIDIFGKAGAAFWSNDVKLSGTTVSDVNGTDFFWGVGAGVHLGPLGVRAEWESVETGDPLNLRMVSLSATIGF